MVKTATYACVGMTLLSLAGSAVLIAWLADKMKSPTFSIDQGAVNDYNFSPDHFLNASFTFVVRSYNRDPKYTIKYSDVAVSVYHNYEYALGYETLGPYTQAHKGDLVFSSRPVARDLLVSDGRVAEAVTNETKLGLLRVEVNVRAGVRYEVKGWKHVHYTLKASCSPVVINLESGKTEHKTNCDVDRFQ